MLFNSFYNKHIGILKLWQHSEIRDKLAPPKDLYKFWTHQTNVWMGSLSHTPEIFWTAPPRNKKKGRRLGSEAPREGRRRDRHQQQFKKPKYGWETFQRPEKMEKSVRYSMLPLRSYRKFHYILSKMYGTTNNLKIKLSILYQW